MTATVQDIKTWIAEAQKRGATHLVVAVDTFDYGNYPIYVMPGGNVQKVVEEHSKNMQRVDEVYSFTGKYPIEDQLKEHRARHLD